MIKTQKHHVSHLPHVCWIDIPADDLKRSKHFYSTLFGWTIGGDKSPLSPDYFLVAGEEKNGEEDPHFLGGILKRMHPDHTITVYFAVASIDAYVEKLKELGGHVIKVKKAIPGWGYFVICTDTENNHFALWEHSKDAK